MLRKYKAYISKIDLTLTLQFNFVNTKYLLLRYKRMINILLMLGMDLTLMANLLFEDLKQEKITNYFTKF